jgi:integrase
MFMLMLRCGLRVEEVANLTRSAVHIERRLIHVKHGKGGNDRIVFLSNDAQKDLADHMAKRPPGRTDKIFLALRCFMWVDLVCKRETDRVKVAPL